MELTDAQWAIIKPLIPTPRRRKDGRGRPWRNPREVLGGILWVLRTGAPWNDLPERYPPYQTCHRRFQRSGAGRARRLGSLSLRSGNWQPTPSKPGFRMAAF